MDNNEEYESVCYILDYWIWLIFKSFQAPQVTSLNPFGGPWTPFWHHFAIKWATDAHRGTQEGPKLDFQRFLMDFGSPFGDHVGSFFDIFCHLKHQKTCLDCRRDFQ